MEFKMYSLIILFWMSIVLLAGTEDIDICENCSNTSLAECPSQSIMTGTQAYDCLDNRVRCTVVVGISETNETYAICLLNFQNLTDTITTEESETKEISLPNDVELMTTKEIFSKDIQKATSMRQELEETTETTQSLLSEEDYQADDPNATASTSNIVDDYDLTTLPAVTELHDFYCYDCYNGHDEDCAQAPKLKVHCRTEIGLKLACYTEVHKPPGNLIFRGCLNTAPLVEAMTKCINISLCDICYEPGCNYKPVFSSAFYSNNNISLIFYLFLFQYIFFANARF